MNTGMIADPVSSAAATLVQQQNFNQLDEFQLIVLNSEQEEDFIRKENLCYNKEIDEFSTIKMNEGKTYQKAKKIITHPKSTMQGTDKEVTKLSYTTKVIP